MRWLFDFLINAYLLPIKLSHRLSLYVKGKIFKYDEHFVIVLNVIKRKFPKDRGVILDIGAYDGDSTIFLARHLPHNKVLGFEPNPIPFERGKRNIIPFKNAELFNLALADKKIEMSLNVTSDSVSSSLFEITNESEFSFKTQIKVSADTLDNVTEHHDNILLIKLDVQGAELKVLNGGIKTLSKTKLVLTELMNQEFYDGGNFYYQIDEMLRTNGFKLFSIICNYNNEGTKYFDALYINSKLV